MGSIKTLAWLAFLTILLASVVSAGFESGSQVKIQTGAEDGFGGENGVWFISFTDDGFTTDQINARFNKDTNLRDGDKTAKQDFSIQVSGTENYCKYDIRREGDRLDVFTVLVTQSEDKFRSWEFNRNELLSKSRDLLAQHQCLQLDSYTGGYPTFVQISEGLLSDSIKIYCYRKGDTLGQIGSLKNLQYVTKTKWTVQADGKQPLSAEVGNDVAVNGRTSNLGSDVKIRWGGQLSSGETCPLPDTEFMAHSSRFPGNWRVIDRANYQVYENFMKIQLQDEISKAARCSNFATCKNQIESQVNSIAGTAIQERSFQSFSPIVAGTSASDGSLRINLNRLIRFPRFTMLVDSDYLEVEIPTGKPKLDKSLGGQCRPDGSIKFSEGDLRAGQFDVRAENVGKNTGGFELRVASCTANFLAGDGTGLRLGAGESVTKTLRTTAQVPPGETLKGSCTIELKETFTGEKDTCTVNLEATKPAQCEEGRVFCSFSGSESVIKECKNGVEIVSEQCSASQICDVNDAGEAICRALRTNSDDVAGETGSKSGSACGAWFSLGGKTIIPDLWCMVTEFIEQFRLVLASIIGFLGSILSMTFIYRFTGGLGVKAQWITSIVAGIVLGVLIGTLAYLLFWVGIIFLFVALVVRVVV